MFRVWGSPKGLFKVSGGGGGEVCFFGEGEALVKASAHLKPETQAKEAATSF